MVEEGSLPRWRNHVTQYEFSSFGSSFHHLVAPLLTFICVNARITHLVEEGSLPRWRYHRHIMNHFKSNQVVPTGTKFPSSLTSSVIVHVWLYIILAAGANQCTIIKVINVGANASTQSIFTVGKMMFLSSCYCTNGVWIKRQNKAQ